MSKDIIMKTKADYTVLSKMSGGTIYSAQMLRENPLLQNCRDEGTCPAVSINDSSTSVRIIGKQVLAKELEEFQTSTGSRVGSDEYCIDLPIEMLEKAGFKYEKL